MRAPTCGNMQLYSVVVSDHRASNRKEIDAAHFNQPAATGAPVILTVCADFNRFNRWCRLSDADSAYGNFLSYSSAATDAVILAQQITTIAEMRGLGVCWLGTVTYNADKIAKALRLPLLCTPVAALAIGWPAETPDLCERLPLKAVLHHGTYREDSDAEVLAQFKAKEDFPANASFPAENGKANLAQVFAEVRYPRSVNEPVSADLISHLKHQGFMQ